MISSNSACVCALESNASCAVGKKDLRLLVLQSGLKLEEALQQKALYFLGFASLPGSSAMLQG